MLGIVKLATIWTGAPAASHHMEPVGTVTPPMVPATAMVSRYCSPKTSVVTCDDDASRSAPGLTKTHRVSAPEPARALWKLMSPAASNQ